MGRVGDAILGALEGRGLTQRELAKLAGVTPQTITYAVRLDRPPSPLTRRSIARALLPSRDDLLQLFEEAVEDEETARRGLLAREASRRDYFKLAHQIVTSAAMIRAASRGGSQTAEGSSPEGVRPTPATFDALLTRGAELAGKGRHPLAVSAFSRALRLASNDLQKVRARLGRSKAYRDLNDPRRAADDVRAAFEDLGVADLSPEHRPSEEQLKARLKDGERLALYGRGSEDLAYLDLKADNQPGAWAKFSTVLTVGRAISDLGVQATARLGLDRVQINQVTEVNFRNRAWTVPVKGRSDARAELSAALDDLVDIYGFYEQVGDEAGLAHVARNILALRRLLSHSAKLMEAAAKQAEQFAGSRPTAANLRLEDARWALAKGELTPAATLFHQAAEDARDIRSPFLLSGALAGLAVVTGGDGSEVPSTYNRKQGIDYATAALLSWTWPDAHRARDFQRSVHLLRVLMAMDAHNSDGYELLRSRHGIEEFLRRFYENSTSSAFAHLRAMPHMQDEEQRTAFYGDLAGSIYKVSLG